MSLAPGRDCDGTTERREAAARPAFAGGGNRDDVEKLLLRHAKRMDLGRVRRLVVEFAAILEAPEQVAEFDRLVKSALSGRTAIGRKSKPARRRARAAQPRPGRS
jgi:hypothetical protein